MISDCHFQNCPGTSLPVVARSLSTGRTTITGNCRPPGANWTPWPFHCSASFWPPVQARD